MNLFHNKGLHVEPIGHTEAAAFVYKHHRHNRFSTGHKFSLALYNDGKLCGVAIVGRPKSRHLDNGTCLEVNRLCVLPGVRNGCSKLYGACVQRARKMNMVSVITYTLTSEHGSSLKASNFVIDREKAGGLKWSSKRKYVTPTNELKTRWIYRLK